jgi:hypothetical protein
MAAEVIVCFDAFTQMKSEIGEPVFANVYGFAWKEFLQIMIEYAAPYPL